MAESGIPSPWNIVKDAVTATTLILCFAVVDWVKRRLFPGEAPLALLVALNAADLTSGVRCVDREIGRVAAQAASLSLSEPRRPACGAPATWEQ
jgi:hypothetical protein